MRTGNDFAAGLRVGHYRDLPAHLLKPGSRDRRTDPVVVEQHDPSPPGAEMRIRFLNELPAGNMLHAGDMSGFVFLARPHIKGIKGSLFDFMPPRLQCRSVDDADIAEFGDTAGTGNRRVHSRIGNLRRAACRSFHHVIACEMPILRAVF